MTTQQEAIKEIVALRDQHWVGDWEYRDRVRVIIEKVTPVVGEVLDRDALRNCIGHALYQGQGEGKPTVDNVMGWIEKEAVRAGEGKQYPHFDGPHLILGPECFTGDGDEFPQDVIMWRGAAYFLQGSVQTVSDGSDAEQLRTVAHHLDAGGKYQATAELMRRVADQLEAAQ